VIRLAGQSLFHYRAGVQPIFLVGPTAVGKTAVAHELAARLGAEIISADSMQVYRGMDIGTAKDKSALLVDLCDVSQPFDVKQYLAAFESKTQNLKSAIVCGGTGLYIRALRRGLFAGPGRDPVLRARLEILPVATLFAELERVDPVTAAKIDRHNPRRLVRALEVFYTTGRPISEMQTQWPVEQASRLFETGPANRRDACSTIFGLDRDRQDLHARIERRIDEQLAAGWLDEVRQLMAAGLERNATAMQAAGYRELVAHLHGTLSLPEAVAQIKTRTRQLARRQLTWFRREPGLRWLTLTAAELPAQTADRMMKEIQEQH
jgi:tRNA dimethylallyltransferase